MAKHESESTYICMDNTRISERTFFVPLGFGGYLLTIAIDTSGNNLVNTIDSDYSATRESVGAARGRQGQQGWEVGLSIRSPCCNRCQWSNVIGQQHVHRAELGERR